MANVEYKGQLKGFPKEVVEKMLEIQVEQGNERDVRVFEKDRYASKEEGGFWWLDTIEGSDFWNRIIQHRDFNAFFIKYPKQETETETSKEDQFIYDFDKVLSDLNITEEQISTELSNKIAKAVFAKLIKI